MRKELFYVDTEEVLAEGALAQTGGQLLDYVTFGKLERSGYLCPVPSEWRDTSKEGRPHDNH